MALRLTNATTLIQIVRSATDPFTIGMWYRRPASASGFAADSTIFRAFGYGMVHNTTSICARVEATLAAPSPVVQPAAGAWVYLAASNNGGGYSVRVFTDTSEQNVSVLGADWKPLIIANAGIGDLEGAFGSGLSDSVYCHLRVWSSILTDSQLNAEKNSATPVITSGLISACPLASSLTATDGTSATVGAGSGYEFIDELPLVLMGGGAVIDPGVILAQLAGVFGPDRGFGFGY